MVSTITKEKKPHVAYYYPHRPHYRRRRAMAHQHVHSHGRENQKDPEYRSGYCSRALVTERFRGYRLIVKHARGEHACAVVKVKNPLKTPESQAFF